MCRRFANCWTKPSAPMPPGAARQTLGCRVTAVSESWNETAFARSLTAGSMALPDGIRAWNGSEPSKRFSVYRNNVRGALVEALAVRYPVVQRLVGKDFFRVMARDYALNDLKRSTC